jgi:hypothetical protein
LAKILASGIALYCKEKEKEKKDKKDLGSWELTCQTVRTA